MKWNRFRGRWSIPSNCACNNQRSSRLSIQLDNLFSLHPHNSLFLSHSILANILHPFSSPLISSLPSYLATAPTPFLTPGIGPTGGSGGKGGNGRFSYKSRVHQSQLSSPGPWPPSFGFAARGLAGAGAGSRRWTPMVLWMSL